MIQWLVELTSGGSTLGSVSVGDPYSVLGGVKEG